MKKRNLYQITKKGDIFMAKYNGHIMFEGKAEKLLQQGIALITTNQNGKHDLYLPVRKIAYNCYHFETNERCLPVLTNISSYQYFDGLFLLRMRKCCLFIQPMNYSMFLSFGKILKKRRENLPKIDFSGDPSDAYIDVKASKEDHYVCKIDGKTYLIDKVFTQFTSTAPQLSITQQ